MNFFFHQAEPGSEASAPDTIFIASTDTTEPILAMYGSLEIQNIIVPNIPFSPFPEPYIKKITFTDAIRQCENTLLMIRNLMNQAKKESTQNEL